MNVLWILFGCALAGVAIFHKRNFWIALAGAIAIMAMKSTQMGGTGWIPHHLAHEAVGITNIFLLITGFGIVAKYFSRTNLPLLASGILPDDWRGAYCLLVMTAAGSFLIDNIAAAMIAGTVATAVFCGRVTVGYISAIVAASNAGGAGSIIGDTTTTMMWISGVSPAEVLLASVGSIPAFCFFAYFASKQQHRYQPIMKDPPKDGLRFEHVYLMIVGAILLFVVITNVVINEKFRSYANTLPWVGLSVWVGILISATIRRPDWKSLKETAPQAIFLSFLILSASMMPIAEFGKATIAKTFGLGVASAGFDNIPLTALAIAVGGFIWGLLAYSVGFGGSMTPFGSSAGVAITTEFPEAKSLWRWWKEGWYVPVSFPIGFAAINLWIYFFGPRN